MYVCVCNAIKEEDLKEIIQTRNCSLKEAIRSLGVGSDCGACIQETIKNMGISDLEPMAPKQDKK